MNIFEKNNYIIKNSSGETLRFYLDKNKKINYDLYDITNVLIDQYLISDDAINSLSLDIDIRDRIHLIYLTNDGSLFYSLYSNNKWAKKTLTQFDIRSNHYSDLTLRVNKENIHILYSFSNLINPKVWTIQHLMGTKGNWEKINVISFMSPKKVPSYSIDFDKFDNIHMVYTSIIDGIQKIYYVFFNSSTRKWSQVPKLLSEHSSNNRHPCVLIDKIDNIHISWLVHEKNKYEVKYMHLAQLGSNRNTWKEEALPPINNEFIYPIILEDKDSIQILLQGNSEILFLISQDYGYSWKLNNILYIPQDIKINIAKYLTNLSTEKNIIKMSQVLFYLDNMKILLNQDFIDYINKYAQLSKKDNEKISMETKRFMTSIDYADNRDFPSSDNEESFKRTKERYDNPNEIELILHNLSDISNNLAKIIDITNNFASQFMDIDNTLLALKESIDISNQCYNDIDRKIKEIIDKDSKKGFWSKLFKRA